MYPIATAPITAVVHPLRRYALIQSHEPLIFTALIGPISLMALGAYYVTPNCKERLVRDRRAFWPFFVSGFFETLALLLMLLAFSLDRSWLSRRSPRLLRSGRLSLAQSFCARLKGSPSPLLLAHCWSLPRSCNRIDTLKYLRHAAGCPFTYRSRLPTKDGAIRQSGSLESFPNRDPGCFVLVDCCADEVNFSRI